MEKYKVGKLSIKSVEEKETNTYSVDVYLSDYDWTEYKIDMRLLLKKYGVVRIVFTYNGSSTSSMLVEQYHDEFKKMVPVDYFEYSSDIFIKYLTLYLSRHVKNCKSEFAKGLDPCLLDFYNEVIKGVSWAKKLKSFVLILVHTH